MTNADAPDTPLANAVALHRAGRVGEAAAAYGGVLAADPDHGDALNLLGVVHAQGGGFAQAVATMAQAVALYPQAASYGGNLRKAAARLDGDGLAAALTGAADALFDRGRGEAAARLYRWVALLRPGDAAAWFNGALAGGGMRAAPGFRRALSLRPDLWPAAAELGGLAFAARDYAGAAGWFRRALGGQGGEAVAWRRLADAVKGTGAYDTACSLYRRALALAPADGGVWFNLGVTLGDLGRAGEAVAAYRRAVAVDPARPGPHFNLSHRLLQTGQWGEGWEEWEWRLAEAVIVPRRDRPLWRGEAMAGKTLLLHAEQGHGDGIQFIRYAPLAAASSGARVVVECPPALVRLFATVPGVAAVRPLGHAPESEVPDFHAVAPLMSLPRLFATTPETVPPSPLLRPPRRKRTPRRVGLVWGCGTDTGDPRRSIPFARLAPLLGVAGATFVSLQMGPAAAQGAGIADGTVGIADFADTAERMMALDLIVSVDTAAAHLAGALGRPVWVLLRHDACWRWLLGRSDTPWYPTARLFRQTAADDWGPVAAAAAAALALWVRDEA